MKQEASATTLTLQSLLLNLKIPLPKSSGEKVGDRHIHPGDFSASCLTCEPSGWGEIYNNLRAAGAGGMVNVGLHRIN